MSTKSILTAGLILTSLVGSATAADSRSIQGPTGQYAYEAALEASNTCKRNCRQYSQTNPAYEGCMMNCSRKYPTPQRPKRQQNHR